MFSLMEILELAKNSFTVTVFVFMMMVLVEYGNVQTRGRWLEALTGKKFGQYLLGALLGILPGCLGSFIMATLYMHRIVGLGAIVTTMIATSGDEAFVMFALFPKQAILLNVILGVVGVIAGFLVDLLFKHYSIRPAKFHELPLHEEPCNCFQKEDIKPQLLNPSLPRVILTILTITVFIGFLTGVLGEREWTWSRVTFIIVSGAALFIVLTVPDHFLKNHIWEHITLRHVPAIFLWTLGALVVIELLLKFVDLKAWISQSGSIIYLLLFIAGIIGLIPESGPHLIIVNMYAQGLIPFSILLTNSIIQDGHGMLPILAQSRKDFLFIKLLNFVVGILVGLIAIWLS